MVAREYALRECSDCGVQAPANETARITEKVLAGTHSSARLYKGTGGGLGIGGSSGTSYRYVERDLCGDCIAVRAAAARRARRGRLLGFLIVIAILAGAVFALSMRGSIENATPTPNKPSAQSDTPQAEAVPDVPVSTFTPAPKSGGDAIPHATEAASAPETRANDPAPASASASAPADAASSTDDARDAILAATPRALETGKPERWKAGDLRGYVVPSAAQDDARRSCRNIYATTVHGQEQEQGSAARWCRPIEGGDWSPQ